MGKRDERNIQAKLRAEKWDAAMDALEANWLQKLTATRAEYSLGHDNAERGVFTSRTRIQRSPSR